MTAIKGRCKPPANRAQQKPGNKTGYLQQAALHQQAEEPMQGCHFFPSPWATEAWHPHFVIRALSQALWRHMLPPSRIYDLKIYHLYLPQTLTGTGFLAVC